jgi:hypothetical protein
MADEETSRPSRKHQFRLCHDGKAISHRALSPGKSEGMAVEMHVGQGFKHQNLTLPTLLLGVPMHPSPPLAGT